MKKNKFPKKNQNKNKRYKFPFSVERSSLNKTMKRFFNKKEQRSMTLQNYAANGMHIAMEKLEERGKEMDYRAEYLEHLPKKYHTCLYVAAESDHLETVTWLLPKDIWSLEDVLLALNVAHLHNFDMLKLLAEYILNKFDIEEITEWPHNTVRTIADRDWPLAVKIIHLPNVENLDFYKATILGDEIEVIETESLFATALMKRDYSTAEHMLMDDNNSPQIVHSYNSTFDNPPVPCVSFYDMLGYDNNQGKPAREEDEDHCIEITQFLYDHADRVSFLPDYSVFMPIYAALKRRAPKFLRYLLLETDVVDFCDLGDRCPKTLILHALSACSQIETWHIIMQYRLQVLEHKPKEICEQLLDACSFEHELNPAGLVFQVFHPDMLAECHAYALFGRDDKRELARKQKALLAAFDVDDRLEIHRDFTKVASWAVPLCLSRDRKLFNVLFHSIACAIYKLVWSGYYQPIPVGEKPSAQHRFIQIIKKLPMEVAYFTLACAYTPDYANNASKIDYYKEHRAICYIFERFANPMGVSRFSFIDQFVKVPLYNYIR